MVASNFKPSLACVYVHEGKVFENVPNDPGGPTKNGVIQRRYDQYRKASGLPLRSVQFLTDEESEEIYEKYYAKAIRFDDLPAGTDYAVFDGAVNSGEGQAGKWLQRAINDVRSLMGQAPILVDGRIGDGTIAALNEIEDQDKVIALIQAKRLAMLKNLKTWKYFGKGWSRRVEDVRKTSQAVARGSIELAPNPTWTKAGGKALITDAKTLPSPTKGMVASFAGTVTTGAAAVAPTLTPAQGINPTLDSVIQGIVIVGALAAAAGAAWAVYANKKAAAISADLDLVVPQVAAA
ncbi:glycosyl hydrolase 108 family protein [Xanthobacter sp. DSM 24535]|uniref:glycoside hydrolase family 108 protein n=1 Tax=Roseixanthobacter psychrophilus TaxID=3119917 RepID=UPI00372C66C9